MKKYLYLGSRLQNDFHKNDLKYIFKEGYKSLDYISVWFYLASQYLFESKAKAAFVSTNSICQGEQVGLIWERLIPFIKISFAYTSFKWSNNAKHNAGVTVVIIGIVSKESSVADLYIYSESSVKKVRSINPYLYEGPFSMMKRLSSPLCEGIPYIRFGAMANDNGNLILDTLEKNNLISKYPILKPYVKLYIGSHEFINGKERWCLYITDNMVEQLTQIEEIKTRFENVYLHRINSSEKSTIAMANYPNRFYFSAYKETESIIVPAVSSESREYIPMGYLDAGVVISNAAFAIYDAEMWLFGLLESKMHMAWVKTVGGRLKTDYRYSAQLCYNTFPFPKISEEKRRQLSEAAEEVLLTRADYPEKTLADLYDPDKMPQDLKKAHATLDDIVDSCYPGYPFASDEARLECLFKLYEKMVSK